MPLLRLTATPPPSVLADLVAGSVASRIAGTTLGQARPGWVVGAVEAQCDRLRLAGIGRVVLATTGGVGVTTDGLVEARAGDWLPAGTSTLSGALRALAARGNDLSVHAYLDRESDASAAVLRAELARRTGLPVTFGLPGASRAPAVIAAVLRSASSRRTLIPTPTRCATRSRSVRRAPPQPTRRHSPATEARSAPAPHRPCGRPGRVGAGRTGAVSTPDGIICNDHVLQYRLMDDEDKGKARWARTAPRSG